MKYIVFYRLATLANLAYLTEAGEWTRERSQAAEFDSTEEAHDCAKVFLRQGMNEWDVRVTGNGFRKP